MSTLENPSDRSKRKLDRLKHKENSIDHYRRSGMIYPGGPTADEIYCNSVLAFYRKALRNGDILRWDLQGIASAIEELEEWEQYEMCAKIKGVYRHKLSIQNETEKTMNWLQSFVHEVRKPYAHGFYGTRKPFISWLFPNR